MKILISEMLDEIRAVLGMTQAQLAVALGVNLNRIKSLSNGRAVNLTAAEIKILVDDLNINPVWLATREGEILRHSSKESVSEVNNSSLTDFVMVPRYDVSASAGGGQIIHSEQIVDHLAFRDGWVSRMGLNRGKLALISVTGDSMSPSLQNNDLVLIDLRVKSLGSDDIYAIQHRGHLLIKRIQIKMDGTIIVISDNPIYGSEVLKPGNEENFIVVGRVVWFGREM